MKPGIAALVADSVNRESSTIVYYGEGENIKDVTQTLLCRPPSQFSSPLSAPHPIIIMDSPKDGLYLPSFPHEMDPVQDASDPVHVIPLELGAQCQLIPEQQTLYYGGWIANPLAATPSYGHLSQTAQVFLEPSQSPPVSQTTPDQQAVSLLGTQR